MRRSTLTLCLLAFLSSSEFALAAPKKKPRANACEHFLAAGMMQYDCASGSYGGSSRPLSAEEKAVGRFVVDQATCMGNPICHAQGVLTALMGGYEPRRPQRVNINAGYTSQILEVPKSCAAAYAEHANPKVAIKIVPDAPGKECKPREKPPVAEEKKEDSKPDESVPDAKVSAAPAATVPAQVGATEMGKVEDGPPVRLVESDPRPERAALPGGSLPPPKLVKGAPSPDLAKGH